MSAITFMPGATLMVGFSEPWLGWSESPLVPDEQIISGVDGDRVMISGG